MDNKVDFNLTNEDKWRTIIDNITDQFVQHVLGLRKVDNKLREETSFELKITLGLFIATQLNDKYSKEMSFDVVEYYFEDIFSLGNNSKHLRRELVELVSDRYEFYLEGLKNEGAKLEDFFRSVGMYLFQFPLQRKDYTNVPFNYDFSKYFSDLEIVSDVLYDLAPSYANAILSEIGLKHAD